jgi:predicted nucleotidyltransferase
LNLEKRIVDEIIDISSKYKNINKVILFGSRARGDNSPKSDIDLAIYADSSIVEFIEDIEINTHTLLEFDFSNINAASDDFFIKQIKKEGIVIYEKC